LGGLIGFKGSTLNALQLIFVQMLNKGLEKTVNVIIDVNGFRKDRENYLINLADQAVDEVRQTGQPVELTPLSSYERRIIHLHLKENEYALTESKGEGEERHIVILPKN